MSLAVVRPIWSTLPSRPLNSITEPIAVPPIAIGEEDAVALDFAAVERAVAQRLQERRAAGDRVGRARRDRDLLLVDFEPDRGLVFQAVDQDRIAEIGVAAIA